MTVGDAACNYTRQSAIASSLGSGTLVGCYGVAVSPFFSSDLSRHLLCELCELFGLRSHRLRIAYAHAKSIAQ